MIGLGRAATVKHRLAEPPRAVLDLLRDHRYELLLVCGVVHAFKYSMPEPWLDRTLLNLIDSCIELRLSHVHVLLLNDLLHE